MARCTAKTKEGKRCKRDAFGAKRCSVHKASSRKSSRKSRKTSKRVSKMDKGRAFGALKKLWRWYRGALEKWQSSKSAANKKNLEAAKKAISDVSKKGGLKPPRFPRG